MVYVFALALIGLNFERVDKGPIHQRLSIEWNYIKFAAFPRELSTSRGLSVTIGFPVVKATSHCPNVLT